MKKYFVECLGTFALSLAVALSIAGSFPMPTFVLAALVLGLFVYSIGSISGCHINPAVTIGLWSIKKINTRDATGYIIAQFLGAGIALSLASSVGPVGLLAGIVVKNSLRIGLAELIGMFFFSFGIASVVYEKTPRDASGLVVGGSLLLGITFAVFFGSNGVLNPAVALGIGSFGLMYILGPIIGSVLGMKVYKALED